VSLGPLSGRVVELCDDTLGQLASEAARAEVVRIKDALVEPVRVAVAGRVKAGKSTLVNALLRQRVAPTDVGECTKVVTWFRYGFPERVEVRCLDGALLRLPLTVEGGLPASLQTEVEQVHSVTAWIANRALERMTIIDTPGLSSMTQRHSQRTVELLRAHVASHEAAGDADAVVFLMTRSASAEDEDALRGFQQAYGDISSSPTNAVGVLSRADQMGGDDAWATASAVASGLTNSLAPVVSTVLPVMGLLAETGESEAFTERDAENLRALAAAPSGDRDLMLLSADGFLAQDSAVPIDDRDRLLALLDLFGIRHCLALIDQGHESATSLVRELRRHSGIEAVRAVLLDRFEGRSDALKADRGLRALHKIAFGTNDSSGAGAMRALRIGIERLRLESSMHRLNEMEAFRDSLSPEGALPPEMDSEMRRIVTNDALPARLGLANGTSAQDLQEAAAESATRWRKFRNSGRCTPAAARIADVVMRSYEILYVQASQHEQAAPLQ
jgi:hypothetical protein